MIFEAETSMDMLEKMQPHYMKKHKEVITNASEEEKKAWMTQFTRDWDAA